MKKPELLLLIAIWEFIVGFIDLVGIAAIGIIAFPAVMYEYRYGFGLDRPGYTAAIFGLSVGIIVLLIYLTVAIAGGIGLLMGKEWGRIISIVQAALSLFSIPFGTVIGILTIIYLTRTSVKEYFTKQVVIIPPVVSPPAAPPSPSP